MKTLNAMNTKGKGEIKTKQRGKKKQHKNNFRIQIVRTMKKYKHETPAYTYTVTHYQTYGHSDTQHID